MKKKKEWSWRRGLIVLKKAIASAVLTYCIPVLVDWQSELERGFSVFPGKKQVKFLSFQKRYEVSSASMHLRQRTLWASGGIRKVSFVSVPVSNRVKGDGYNTLIFVW